MRKSGQGNVISPENNMTLQDLISMQILYLNFSQEIVVFIGVVVPDQIGKAFQWAETWWCSSGRNDAEHLAFLLDAMVCPELGEMDLLKWKFYQKAAF